MPDYGFHGTHAMIPSADTWREEVINRRNAVADELAKIRQLLDANVSGEVELDHISAPPLASSCSLWDTRSTATATMVVTIGELPETGDDK